VAAAERLFAERGIAGVSLRDVSAAAGQRNHSAAQYHFGGRQGLVVAVYDARMQAVDERRAAYLDALHEQGRGGDPRALVEAIVVPLVEIVAQTDAWYARFLARSRWDPAAWAAILAVPARSFSTAMRQLEATMADLPAPIRKHRLDQLMTRIVGTLAGWEGAPDRGERRLRADELTDELVSTSTALLTATTVPVELTPLPVP
jgi:AcrR family transcriptional regulator